MNEELLTRKQLDDEPRLAAERDMQEDAKWRAYWDEQFKKAKLHGT